GELWATQLETGNNERLLPGFQATNYDVSPDDKRVAYAVLGSNGKRQLWLASLDRRFPPRQLSSGGDEDLPRFGPAGDLYFRSREGPSSFVYRMKEDGSGRQKAIPDPILHFHDVSPDGQWVVARVAIPGIESTVGTMALSTKGGPSVRICVLCGSRWTPDGKWFTVAFGRMGHPTAGAGTLVFPVDARRALPALPAGGLYSLDDPLR